MALFVSCFAQGQCKPLDAAAKPQPFAAQASAPGLPEFSDDPHFTVAGVTDATNPGGHGSDAVLRTKEALARETVSLGKNASGSSHPDVTATETSLREAAQAPGSFETNYQLGKLLVADGKIQEALPYLERASRFSAAAKSNSDQAEVHHLLGDVEEKLGQPLEAVRNYQRAAELDPSEPNLFDWGAELLLHRGVEPAVEVFTKGNRRFPHSVRMLLGLGVAWYDRGAHQQAAQRLCEASDLQPDNPTPYAFLGNIQSVEIAGAQGISERLNRFVTLHPENALANYYYAVSLQKQRRAVENAADPTQIESLLQKATRLDPKLGLAYLQLGTVYSERRDFPKAISVYQHAIEVSPQLEEPHYRLAQVYRQMGEKLKAQQELQLYDQVKSEGARKSEHERREIKEFVYASRGQPSAAERP